MGTSWWMPWQRRMFAVATPRTWQILLVVHCKWLGKCTTGRSGKGGINRRNWSTKKIMDNTKARTRMIHHVGAPGPIAREMLELLTMVKESKGRLGTSWLATDGNSLPVNWFSDDWSMIDAEMIQTSVVHTDSAETLNVGIAHHGKRIHPKVASSWEQSGRK